MVTWMLYYLESDGRLVKPVMAHDISIQQWTCTLHSQCQHSLSGTWRCSVCTWQGFGSGSCKGGLCEISSCTPARQVHEPARKEWSQAWEDGGQEGGFFVLSLFYQPDVFNWNKKITVIFQGESVMPVAVIGNWCLCLLPQRGFSSYFLPLVLLRRRAKGAAWWVSASWPMSAPHKKLWRSACATGRAKILDMLGTCRGTEKDLFSNT